MAVNRHHFITSDTVTVTLLLPSSTQLYTHIKGFVLIQIELRRSCDFITGRLSLYYKQWGICLPATLIFIASTVTKLSAFKADRTENYTTHTLTSVIQIELRHSCDYIASSTLLPMSASLICISVKMLCMSISNPDSATYAIS